MSDLTLLTVLAASSEIENTNLFPFPQPLHIGFAVVALLFFAYRFFTDKKPFQLIMAVAIPFSLTIWLSASKTWFYAVGAIELVLILAAAVSTFVCKDKSEPEPETAPAADEKAAEE